MRTGNKGIELIKHFEGLELKAYKCPANVWTIGYGHTKGVMSHDEISEEEADLFLREDLADAERFVTELVPIILEQHQFDALVSWVYNLGPTNFVSSTLLKRLKSYDLDDVPTQIKRWDKANGKRLPGLTKRREAEARLFETGEWRA